MKILVATDLSGASEAAIQYAVSFMKPLDAIITLFHILEPMGGDAVFIAAYDASITDANESLEKLRDRYEIPERLCNIKVEVGFPAERILHAVKSDQYSIVIMGMQQDLSAIDRDIFGSNAYDVIKHGKCAVLTVPEGFPVREVKNIVLAVSLAAQENIYLLSLLKRLAKHYAAHITLLHIKKEDNLVLDKTKTTAIHWLKEQLDDISFTFVTETSDHVSEAIHIYADEHQTDLLIMSPETQGFLMRLIQGSTTRRTILHSEVPTLTFPMDYT